MNRRLRLPLCLLALLLGAALLTILPGCDYEIQRKPTITPTFTPWPTSTKVPTRTPSPSPTPTIEDAAFRNRTYFVVRAYGWLEKNGTPVENRCRLGLQARIEVEVLNDSPFEYTRIHVSFVGDHDRNFFQGLLYDKAPGALEVSSTRGEWLTGKGILFRQVDTRTFLFRPGLMPGEENYYIVDLIPGVVGEWETSVEIYVELAGGRLIPLYPVQQIKLLVLPATS